MTSKTTKNMLDDLIKEHLAQGKDPKELLSKEGLLGQLTKALVERCLEAEMDEHLGYEKDERAGKGSENRRNGYLLTHPAYFRRDASFRVAHVKSARSEFFIWYHKQWHMQLN